MWDTVQLEIFFSKPCRLSDLWQNLNGDSVVEIVNGFLNYVTRSHFDGQGSIPRLGIYFATLDSIVSRCLVLFDI